MYYKGKLCKEKVTAGRGRQSCAMRVHETSRALVKLDHMRKDTIHQLHEQAMDVLAACVQRVRSEYKEFGSVSITSDYDVTILSPFAPEICAYMLLAYFFKCSVSMETAFDTNLYTIGYFLKGPYQAALERNILQVPDHKIMALQPCSQVQGEKMITYACMKLLHGKQDATCMVPIMTTRMKIFLDGAMRLYRESQTTYPSAVLPIVREAYRELPKRRQSIVDIGRHCLQYYFSTQLFDLVYAGKDAEDRAKFAAWNNTRRKPLALALMKKIIAALDEVLLRQRKGGKQMDWIDLSALGSIYQVDAYYTLCSVNTVVLEIQRRKGQPETAQRRYFRNYNNADIALAPVNYICTFIECSGDVLHNYEQFRHSDVPANIFAPKLEKYMLRIEYCLRILKSYIPDLAYMYDTLKTYHDTLRKNHKVHSFMLVFKLIVSALLDCVVSNIHQRKLYDV